MGIINREHKMDREEMGGRLNLACLLCITRYGNSSIKIPATKARDICPLPKLMRQNWLAYHMVFAIAQIGQSIFH